MATKQARNSSLFLPIILLILASVNAKQLPNPCLATTPTPIGPPTPAPAPDMVPTPSPAPEVVAPAHSPSSSPTPAVTPAQAPTSLPKCPLVSADLSACVTLGLGNNPVSSARQQCCSKISNLGNSIAASCLCDAMKVDVRVGVNVSIPPIIVAILNLCGQVTTSDVVCIR